MSNRGAKERFQDEAFEAIMDYLDTPHCAWEDLDEFELRDFKTTMFDSFKYRYDSKFQSHADCIRIVGGDCGRLCDVIDAVAERMFEEEELTYSGEVVQVFNKYWEYILFDTIYRNWEGVLLYWEHYSRPHSEDENNEENN
jgi:hypothetical protein